MHPVFAGLVYESALHATRIIESSYQPLTQSRIYHSLGARFLKFHQEAAWISEPQLLDRKFSNASCILGLFICVYTPPVRIFRR